MKAFVTGSTGLLGNNLVRMLLAQGHEVKAMARSAEKATKLLGDTSADIVIGDMANVDQFAAELAGCDVLFHLAAYFREYYGGGVEDHWATLKKINIDATLDLLNAADSHHVQKVIFVSSMGALGDTKDGSPAIETTPPDQYSYANLYFKSKVFGEEAIVQWRRTHSLPVVVIRPGWMFGPYDAAPTGSGQMVLNYMAGALPGVIDGGSSLVDVRDVAEAMIKAAEHDSVSDGDVFNVAGRTVRLAEVYNILEQVTGIPAPSRKIPYRLALMVASVVETAAKLRGKPAMLTPDALKSMRRGLTRLVSSEKAERELGITFRPVQETIKDTVEWLQASITQ